LNRCGCTFLKKHSYRAASGPILSQIQQELSWYSAGRLQFNGQWSNFNLNEKDFKEDRFKKTFLISFFLTRKRKTVEDRAPIKFGENNWNQVKISIVAPLHSYVNIPYT
jgi:hypothetical protein